jgi:eukaryotic-like serine/threonine-protein kinase
MLNAQLAELEQAFRDHWEGYHPEKYSNYLDQVAAEDRTSLLARLLAAELEYVYQPPNRSDYLSNTAASSSGSEDEDQIKPSVILLLHRFPEIRRDRELAIQLIMLEFALRLRFDAQVPHYDSYLELCPEEKERLGSMMALLEDKLNRAGAEVSPPTHHDDTTVSEQPATHKISLAQLPYCLSYFLLTDVIGRGGMGTVYHAIDLRSAAPVAVKVISGADSWSVYRFIEEFSWLSKLNHPNLVRLYDTFSEGDLRFFSMEVVEGQSICDWFALQTGENRWDRLRQMLSQTALAVAFLHQHEVIHRDIKSSNLMISREGRAVLLDLGLAMRAGDQQAASSHLDGPCLVGTLHALAPEVLNGAIPTFASDWYSFGVMLFETITGSFPEVKVQLSDLLTADPEARPADAEILERLGSHTGQPIPLVWSESDFVGREAAIAWLDSGLRIVDQGNSALRLVRGDSGLGKTTLLQHWLRTRVSPATTASAPVLCLNVRCHSQDHTPLKALNLLVQELVNCLAQRPPELWLDLAHGGGEEIVYTFPQIERLGQVAWPKQSRSADSMEGVARRAVGLHALMGWLQSLSQRVSMIISIDDAQWADAESGRILAQLLRGQDEFRGLLIVIDQGSQVASPLVQSLTDSDPSPVTSDCVYELPRLAREECQELLRRWSQRLQLACGAEVVSNILNRSQGSPFLLQELLRSYVNYTVRNRLTDEVWLMATKQEPGLMSNRFAMLTPAAEKILQFLAVSPQPLGIYQLQTVSRIVPGALLAELRLLAAQGWIRWNGAAIDAEVEMSHEQFRTLVLEAMQRERLQRRHYRLARMLSLEVPPPWRRIAHHYSEAQQPREAAACYMDGARAAAQRLSYDEALWMLERAFHPLAQRTAAENRAALRLRADCLAGQGNAMAAAKAYTALAEEETDDVQLIQCLAGEQWIRAGRLDSGLENLKSAIEQLGIDRSHWWPERNSVRSGWNDQRARSFPRWSNA